MSIIAEHFKPFFYVKVDDWTIKKLIFHIKDKIIKYYEDSITECKLLSEKSYTDLMEENCINL